MKLRLFRKRLLNGIALEYSLNELLQLVILKKVVSFFNNWKRKDDVKFMEIKFHELFVSIISLDTRIDRREKITNSLSQNGITFRFVNAIDGSKIIPSNYSDFFSKQSIESLSKGSIGCILSHYKALEIIANSHNNFALIFEDDVVLPKGFKGKLELVLKEIPRNFDILYLASNLSRRSDMRYWVSNNLYVPVYPRSGQYAYLISKKGAQKIILNIKPVNILLGGIDTIIGRMVSKGELIAYHVRDNLCVVDYESPSNIDNASNPNKKIFKS
ncbi:GR25 family glycosyltransferase involved in LPS biosynthesis [Lacibacter cauensis]|uniref:GR25 family glycosyltransferase involved in LPS biosynthesis n=1 Tax=Lacibacter cauensis TaxID=510947 RepID=A0A562SUW6_9BACT|nr:glycosyltransferase family 25 protein [Lacibacter cauensis]TWI84983.1 GR25 family glycosyltransferase involved in LPS biosynthesis [Lacibacter cauensis]